MCAKCGPETWPSPALARPLHRRTERLGNAYGQHAVVPYPVRALPAAPVATPLRREELDEALVAGMVADVPAVTAVAASIAIILVEA